jgi:hypothetical protein
MRNDVSECFQNKGAYNHRNRELDGDARRRHGGEGAVCPSLGGSSSFKPLSLYSCAVEVARGPGMPETGNRRRIKGNFFCFFFFSVQSGMVLLLGWAFLASPGNITWGGGPGPSYLFIWPQLHSLH